MNKQLKIIQQIESLLQKLRAECDTSLSQIAPGHNPDKLTVKQVGEGWRLLDRDEIKYRKQTRHIQRFQDNQWDNTWVSGFVLSITYRTKLSREELAKLP